MIPDARADQCAEEIDLGELRVVMRAAVPALSSLHPDARSREDAVISFLHNSCRIADSPRVTYSDSNENAEDTRL